MKRGASGSQQKRPPIADKPPFPKAHTGVRVFEFGSMGVSEEKRHTFRIDNKGQGPLLIAKGPTNCKCTISNISKSTIPPGQSADIEMSWTPRETTNTFAKTATIWTNDPDLPEIQFKIFGKVVKQFAVTPERNWHAGHVTDVQDGTIVGMVTSQMDPDFKILSVESADPHVKTQYRRLTKKQRMREGSKAGYEFTVTVDKGIPPGHFRRPLKIHTTLEGNKTIDVEVTAVRSGPMLFLPPIGTTRVFWNSEKALVNLGRFPHDVGAKVTLPALVYGTKEKFKILSVEKDADFVQVTAEPNHEIGNGAAARGSVHFRGPAGFAPRYADYAGRRAYHAQNESSGPQRNDLRNRVRFAISRVSRGRAPGSGRILELSASRRLWSRIRCASRGSRAPRRPLACPFIPGTTLHCRTTAANGFPSSSKCRWAPTSNMSWTNRPAC